MSDKNISQTYQPKCQPTSSSDFTIVFVAHTAISPSLKIQDSRVSRPKKCSQLYKYTGLNINFKMFHIKYRTSEKYHDFNYKTNVCCNDFVPPSDKTRTFVRVWALGSSQTLVSHFLFATVFWFGNLFGVDLFVIPCVILLWMHL